MIKAACIVVALALATAAPAVAQPKSGTDSPPPKAPASPATPSPADAAFNVDTYTCQDVLDDLAAQRQNRIGIAVIVIYAQLRASNTPTDHIFSLLAIQQTASSAGASCASGGGRERLLRDVVAAQMSPSSQ